MKRFFRFAIASLALMLGLAPVGLRAQRIIWERNYNTGGGSSLGGLLHDPIGGYLLFGMADLALDERPWVLHVDDEGSVLWSSTFGTGHYTPVESSYVDSSGAVTIFGYTQPDTATTGTHEDVYMGRLEPDGTPSLFTLAGLQDNVGYGSAMLSDGSYVITGAGDSGISLLKLDRTGHRLWYKQYGGSSYRYGFNVAALDDGGFLIMGEAVADYPPDGLPIIHVMLVRTNADGDSLWTRYASDEDLDAGAYQRTDDGGFLIVGRTNYGVPIPYIMKLDSSANHQWTKLVEPPFQHRGLIPAGLIRAHDGDYIETGIVMNVEADSSVAYRPLLWKFGADGTTRWMMTLNDSDKTLLATGVAETDDGALLIGGSRNYPANGGGFLIKVTMPVSSVPQGEYQMLKLDLSDAGSTRDENH